MAVTRATRVTSLPYPQLATWTTYADSFPLVAPLWSFWTLSIDSKIHNDVHTYTERKLEARFRSSPNTSIQHIDKASKKSSDLLTGVKEFKKTVCWQLTCSSFLEVRSEYPENNLRSSMAVSDAVGRRWRTLVHRFALVAGRLRTSGASSHSGLPATARYCLLHYSSYDHAYSSERSYSALRPCNWLGFTWRCHIGCLLCLTCSRRRRRYTFDDSYNDSCEDR